MSAEETWFSRCEAGIRRSPRQAVGTAFLVGLVVRILPVAALVRFVVSVLMTLLRPALLVLGVSKAVEIARDCRRSSVPEM